MPDSKKLQVSFIIPNFNGKELLQKSLSKLTKLYPNNEIILVDDGSTDGSADFVKKNFPKVKLIRKNKNTGFSSTCNLGAKKASCDLLVFLNTDVVVRDGFLEKIQVFFKNKNTFGVGLCDLSHEDGQKVARGAGGGKFKRGFLIHWREDNKKNKTLWVSGGSGVFKKDLFLKLGGFDEIYDPFYWEDIDLSYRALKAGFKIYFANNIKLDHYHGLGSINKNYSNYQIQTISFRNQIIFIWKNISSFKYLILHFIFLPYHLLITNVKSRGAFFLGFLRAIICIKTILKKRAKQKNTYLLKDNEII